MMTKVCNFYTVEYVGRGLNKYQYLGKHWDKNKSAYFIWVWLILDLKSNIEVEPSEQLCWLGTKLYHHHE